MPYDLLAQGGVITGLVILLGFLLKTNTDEKVKSNQRHEDLIQRVMQECKEEKNMLMVQLDRYNDSLQENTKQLQNISENLKVIPFMQKDIEELKDKCHF